ncbi:MAG: diguanylate cyclase [Candidatus Hydrogenedentes bacterium]|nr:diguanylate cyclase [Candidatus Hydrogenedentota bacterium]MBI3119012.1 diguanylate cyclase [Candidatus Hydrogenedentota bacterium]
MTAPLNGHGATILVVEDDANMLHIIRDYLMRAGFRVHTATNGWEALKRLKEDAFDLVVAESEISDMDGCRLREKFLLNPESREVPFLFLIPAEQTEKHVVALRSGVDDCIGKPFDPIVLVARVQAVLERRFAFEQFVRIDPLTRLLNRPTVQKEIAEELQRAQRYSRSAALILLDIDGFHKINEDSGVAMGDLLLTCFAGIILSSIRTVDLAGRIRGEKFLLFLPETDDEGARILTQRIQEQLNTITDVVAGYSLTFSAGIVTIPQHGSALEQLQDRAAAALRHAKEFTNGAIAVWDETIAAFAQ